MSPFSRRSRGVPMIVGVDVDHLEDGRDALLDGDAGLLIVDPDTDTRAAYRQRRAEQAEARQGGGFVQRSRADGHRRTGSGHDQCHRARRTRDARSLPRRRHRPDADRVSVSGARTTSDRGRAIPDLQAHGRMGRRQAGDHPHPRCRRRQADRGFDAGRTTSIRFSACAACGCRCGIWTCFAQQLRALARAAVAGNLKVMIPMVTVPEELDQLSRAVRAGLSRSCAARASRHKCRRSA